MTKEDLRSLGFLFVGGSEYCTEDWEYMYCKADGTLWDINDGYGDPLLLAKGLTNLTDLKLAMEALGYGTEEESL